MVDGITLHATHTPHEPPDAVKQVVDMVRSLSNKYVPTPSLDKVEINLLQGLKDFRHWVRKRAAAVKLCKGMVNAPARCPVGPIQVARPSNDMSDINSWHEAKESKESNPDWYGFGSNLYDTISAFLEADSAKKQLQHFLDKLEMEIVNSIKALRKEDTRSIPECNYVLLERLRALAEDPNWSVVQSDKSGQWLPIHINDYIADMEVHLTRYCKEIPCANLDSIHRDTNPIMDDIEHLCFDGETDFLQSWVKTKKIPSVRLSVKDHKLVKANGRHPTRLIVLVHNFTQCLSKLASKSIEKSFLRANINFEKHTLKNFLALKRKFESMDLQWDNVTIVSLDIKDMYPQCQFKAVKAVVRHYSSHLHPLQQEKEK
jgi:hypothetical protein